MPEEVEFQMGNSACGPAQELETVTHTDTEVSVAELLFSPTLCSFFLCVKDAVHKIK